MMHKLEIGDHLLTGLEELLPIIVGLTDQSHHQNWQTNLQNWSSHFPADRKPDDNEIIPSSQVLLGCLVAWLLDFFSYLLHL